MGIVLYKTDDFLIAYKMHNIPTVPLKGQNAQTLLSQVSKEEIKVLESYGKNPWEGSALHRLDTVTAGLVLFALNKPFYDHMVKIQKEDLFVKTYKAQSEIPAKEIPKSFSSYFRAYGVGRKAVKVCLSKDNADSGKLYTTTFKIIKTDVLNTVFECKITQGFRHQIRCHLAYLGHPIKGDEIYNPQGKKNDLALECTGLEFVLQNGQKFTYTLE